MSITRRLFLSVTAGSAVGATVTEAAGESVNHGTHFSQRDADPHAKVERLAAELALAMKAIYPDIEFYTVDWEADFVMCARGMKRGTRVEVATA